MKTLSVFLFSGLILFLIQPNAVACSLNPTANIVTDPEGIVFYHNEAVGFEGTTSTANCGSINQYRWRIDDVTVSWNSVYPHTFSLAGGESVREFKVQLRVRNSAGKYGYKTIYVTVTRNNKSLYYLTDHLGSVRVTVNEKGDPVGWDDYYPFGLQMPERTQNQSNPNDDSKFTGYLLEQEGDLGIYHAEARMYDPVIGRFYSVDPLASVFPGWTPYTYALNNPLIYIDPDGRLSTHVDSTGAVIEVYDDGDHGVYVHSDVSTKEEIDKKRDETGTTSGGGKKIGETEFIDEFRPGNLLDLNYGSIDEWVAIQQYKYVISQPSGRLKNYMRGDTELQGGSVAAKDLFIKLTGRGATDTFGERSRRECIA